MEALGKDLLHQQRMKKYTYSAYPILNAVPGRNKNMCWFDVKVVHNSFATLIETPIFIVCTSLIVIRIRWFCAIGVKLNIFSKKTDN